MEWRLATRLSLLLAGILTATGAARGQSLEARINALLGAESIKTASVGISVVEVKPGAPPVDLYAHNAALPLGPASNTKLLTTAAAFEKYGPKAGFKTVLYKIGDDLLLVGGGDPGLGDAKLAGDEKVTAVFAQWAQRLAQLGVTQFRDLIVDDRVFDNQWTNPNWPADQSLDWYSAPVGGLNFNANCLDWIPTVSPSGSVGVELIPPTTYVHVTIKAKKGAGPVSMWRRPSSHDFELRGSVERGGTKAFNVPIDDPGLWTGTILRDLLADAGVKGTGALRRAADGEKWGPATLLAQHETPLLAVMARANKDSLNMVAECFCKRLGHDATGQPGSWTNGTAAVLAYAKSVGVDDGLITLDDGSGLSSKNRVAAKAFTAVLAHVAARPDGDSFITTLAEPGEEGTLHGRFKAMSVAPHVHAKTGHINGVSTLSGYIEMDADHAPAGRRFAFSILCNKHKGNANPVQDQICQAIYDWAKGK